MLFVLIFIDFMYYLSCIFIHLLFDPQTASLLLNWLIDWLIFASINVKFGTFIKAVCCLCGAEKPFLYHWVNAIPAWLPVIRQELSYRKQIARQLFTQYVEGIYRPKYYTVTLKSRLRVTQGHCKQNHWIDHTRLSSSRVIWHWILSWPWNVGYRSLKVI